MTIFCVASRLPPGRVEPDDHGRGAAAAAFAMPSAR